MKIDWTQALQDLHGRVIKARAPMEGEAPEAVPDSTLGDVCVQSVTTSLETDAKTPGLGYRLYTLAHTIKDGGEITVDDATLIKARAEQLFGPLVVGEIWSRLEAVETSATLPAAKPGRTRRLQA